ncbi:MAG: transglutaminase-like cysteine peptidase [Rhodospirillales bacterium]|nr:transglutaminase-like cysteine peptidase [Rhodospirillales bacterium]
MKEKTKSKSGILAGLRTVMERNRLGELMVMNGFLTPHELKYALVSQKTSREQLGRILLRERMVRRRDLYRALVQQWSLRLLVTVMTVMIGASAVGVKPARAGTIKDIPAQVKLASAANVVFAPVKGYPALFGTSERRSYNLDAFTKWTGMFQRFEAAVKTEQGQRVLYEWKKDLHEFEGLPLEDMIEEVNDLINGQRYIVDSRNFGQSDYWGTPVEFFTRGGDCEDFAIAKYVSLRALGVPEERLRVAIVQDQQKNIPHAVLVVYTDDGPMMLDNQIKSVRPTSSVHHYRPIFSINRQAWWLHTQPSRTVLASAQ